MKRELIIDAMKLIGGFLGACGFAMLAIGKNDQYNKLKSQKTAEKVKNENTVKKANDSSIAYALCSAFLLLSICSQFRKLNPVLMIMNSVIGALAGCGALFFISEEAYYNLKRTNLTTLGQGAFALSWVAPAYVFYQGVKMFSDNVLKR